MLSDADLESLQADFGTLASKSACTVKRGTPTAVGGQKAGYTTQFTHTCTVLSLTQIKDAYLESFAKSFSQATRNPRVILFPLPFPTGKEVKRGDVIVVGTDDFKVLDLDNNDSYQFQRIAFCQYVEGGAA